MSTLGTIVRERRKQFRWTQQKLARRARLSQGWISKIESGDAPSFVHMVAIARVLALSLDWVSIRMSKRRT